MGTLIRLKTKRVGSPAAGHWQPEAARLERDLLGPLCLLWLGSVVRVALALAHREFFQTEATLALLCVVLLPLLAVRAWLDARTSRTNVVMRG